MKLSIGTLLALVTLIGSILIGGANFGEVRGTVTSHTQRLCAVEDRIKTVEDHIIEMNKRSVEIATNLEWIKITLANEKERIKALK